jgi:DNA-binding MarR family transcriptional regulator
MQVSRVNRPVDHPVGLTGNRTVADRLHSAAIHLLRRLRRQDDAMGLTPARASALSIMVFGGPVTLGQLAVAEQVSAPTTTRLVVGMERDGLVRREDDPNDGRVVWLHPTAKGTRLLHEGRQRRVAALASEIAALDEAERMTLAAAADIIERVLAGPEQGGTGATDRTEGTSGTVSTRGTGRKGRMGGRGRVRGKGGTGSTSGMGSSGGTPRPGRMGGMGRKGGTGR